MNTKNCVGAKTVVAASGSAGAVPYATSGARGPCPAPACIGDEIGTRAADRPRARDAMRNG
jgi:hypothetical protein